MDAAAKQRPSATQRLAALGCASARREMVARTPRPHTASSKRIRGVNVENRVVREPLGRSEARVTNNSADTSVAGAMVLALCSHARRIAYPFVQVGNGCEGKTCQRSGPCEVGPAESGQRPPSRIKADGSVLRTRIAAKRRSRCSNNRGYSGRRDQRYTFLPRPIRSSTWHPV
jgi:hypothetical protein